MRHGSGFKPVYQRLGGAEGNTRIAMNVPRGTMGAILLHFLRKHS